MKNGMKRVLSLTLALALFMSFWVPGKVQAADNLLTDGSFDNPMTVMTDGNLPSYGFWTSMSFASANQEPENAYTGSGLAHLLYAADGVPAGDFPTIYQDVAVAPNSIYRLIFWARNWNPTVSTPLYYGYRDPNGDVWSPVEQFDVSDLGSEYRQITLEFDTKDLTAVRIFAFTITVADALGGYHLDDFSLEYVKPSIPEEAGGLLKDGSFEQPLTPMTDGNLPSYGVWTGMSRAYQLVEPENARTGNGLAHLLYAADGIPAGEFPTVYQDVEVRQNAIYRLTFWARNWQPAITTPLFYGYRDPNGDVWSPVEQYEVSNLGGDYRQITLEFNTKDLTAVRIFAFTITVAEGLGGYHLDDFKLEFVREAEPVPEDTRCHAPVEIGGSVFDCVVDLQGYLTSSGSDTLYDGGTVAVPLMFLGGDGVWYPVLAQELQGTPETLFALEETILSGGELLTRTGWKTWENGHYYLEYIVADGQQETKVEFSVKLTQPDSGKSGAPVQFAGVVPKETDDPNNLLKNGGFIRDLTPMTDGELPSIGNWTSMSWASVVWEPENARTGRGLANLVYAVSGLPEGEFPTIYQDVQVQPNSNYRLTFWARNWNIEGAPQPLYYGYRNGSEDVWTPVEQYEVTDIGNEYREITLKFNTGDLTVVRIFAFTTSVAEGLGGYHLDDFYLECLPEEKVQIGDATYGSLTEALAHYEEGGDPMVLLADVEENVTVSSDVYLDLNGKTLTGDITVTGGAKFSGMDSTTDTYEVGTGKVVGEITGEGFEKTVRDGNSKKRYVAVQGEDGSWTFNRFYIGMKSINADVNTGDVGYVAIVGGNENVKNALADNAYGFAVWVEDYEGNKQAPSLTKDAFVTGSAGSTVKLRIKNQLSIINELYEGGQTTDAADLQAKKVYAQVTVLFDGAAPVESEIYAFSIVEMYQNLDAGFASFTESQQASLRALTEKYPVMKTWNLTNMASQ